MASGDYHRCKFCNCKIVYATSEPLDESVCMACVAPFVSIARHVAEHFEGTDAPLGALARALIAGVKE